MSKTTPQLVTIALENQKPPKKLQKKVVASVQKKKGPENSENSILQKLYSL